MTTGWQPIETAPLDGSTVWIRYPLLYTIEDNLKPRYYKNAIVKWSTWDRAWREWPGGEFLKVNAEDWIKHWYPFTVPPPFEEPI